MRAVLMSALLLIGCGATSQSRTASLSESITAYNDSVRWERFELAAGAIPPRERPQFVDDMDERAHEVKITEYDIVRVDPHGDEAKVQIKMSWYKASEGTVHETYALQTWEHRGKAWWMVEETRVRGAEMPGLPEPAAGGRHEPANGSQAPTGSR
ncbi:MAG TPA: hypothetical protein VFP84_19140 [Kofleriaceae bacterium]|nr:hypothetical protein [Kofleriaceae bacterium]